MPAFDDVAISPLGLAILDELNRRGYSLDNPPTDEVFDAVAAELKRDPPQSGNSPERSAGSADADPADGVSSAARAVADASSLAPPRDARRSGSGASRAGAAPRDFVRPSTPHVLTSWRLSTRSSPLTPQADPGGPGRRHTL